jgi:phospholipid/cholesterol/gamma-HCH transport system substrate-binding protein
VALSVFAVFCAVVFFVLFRAGGGRTPADGGYQVQVVVPDAVALADSAQVRMAGVRAGHVSDIANRAGTAVLMVRLKDDYAPIYRDARAQVRTKSLLGENYLDIDPGTPQAGTIPENGVLPIENADVSTQLDQILTVLDGPARRDLSRMLRGFGGGLDGRGDDLNRMFAATSGAADAGAPVFAVMAERRTQAAGLIDDLGRVMRAVGDRGEALRVLARRGKLTAEAVASRDHALADTLDALPSTLGQLQATTRNLQGFSAGAPPVLADLATALERLEPAVRDLGPAATAARPALAALEAFSPRAAPLLVELRKVARTAAPAAHGIDAALAEANPLVEYLSGYSREFGALFANTLSSSSNTRDATGNLIRIYGLYDDTSVQSLTGLSKPVLDELFKLGALHRLRTRGTNAYPKPGEIGTDAPIAKHYPRLTALPRTLRDR